MHFFTIAGLTIREAIRRRTLLGAFLLGLLVLALSLVITVIHHRMEGSAHRHQWPPGVFALRFAAAEAVVTSLCLSSIKALGGLFAVMMAGGSVSSEIERGLLAVILPKPMARWQILLGKWIGLNCILVCSVFVWVGMLWVSLTWQEHRDLTVLLHAAPYLALYPIVICTLALSLSTFAQRVFGTSLALALMSFAWFDGILNGLAKQFDTDSLHNLAVVAGLVVPQGYIGWWVEGVTSDLIVPPELNPGRRKPNMDWISPQYLNEVGSRFHIPHLDAIYLVFYIIVVFLFGVIVFQRRDV